jgi:hypothetical protein
MNFADESGSLTADNVRNEGNRIAAVYAWEFGYYINCGQQLSARLAICSQLQLVSSVAHHVGYALEQRVFLYVKYGSATKFRRKC